MSGGLYVKLDVTFFSDDRIVELSPEAQLLYVRALCLCKTLETDGVFTAPQLQSTGAKLGSGREPLRYLRELTASHCDGARGAGAGSPRHTCGAACSAPVEQLDSRTYRIAGWLKHNKPASEIKEIRGRRAEAGKAGGKASSEKRAEQGKQNPSNLLGGFQAKSAQTETETERKTTTAAPPSPVDNPQEDARSAAVVGLLAKRAAERNATTNPGGYERIAAAAIEVERGDEIRKLLHDQPAASPQVIAELLSTPSNGTRPAAPDNPQQQAERQRQAMTPLDRAKEALRVAKMTGDALTIEAAEIELAQLVAPSVPVLEAVAS